MLMKHDVDDSSMTTDQISRSIHGQLLVAYLYILQQRKFFTFRSVKYYVLCVF